MQGKRKACMKSGDHTEMHLLKRTPRLRNHVTPLQRCAPERSSLQAWRTFLCSKPWLKYVPVFMFLVSFLCHWKVVLFRQFCVSTRTCFWYFHVLNVPVCLGRYLLVLANDASTNNMAMSIMLFQHTTGMMSTRMWCHSHFQISTTFIVTLNGRWWQVNYNKKYEKATPKMCDYREDINSPCSGRAQVSKQ